MDINTDQIRAVRDFQLIENSVPPANANTDVQKEANVERNRGSNDLQKELIALLSKGESEDRINNIARKQIEQGYLDIKV